MKLDAKRKLKRNLVLIFGLFFIMFFGVSCTIKKNDCIEEIPETNLKWPKNNDALITKETLKLDLMSDYGDNEATHPKVIAFDEPWHGYYYWVAFTPYPKADQGKENPHILASNDMIDWEQPNGFDNPLEGKPDGNPKYFYNSDTHLLYNEEEDRIECYWRYVDDVNRIVVIYRSYTYDGSTWSKKEVFLKANRWKTDYLSPVVMIEDNMYKVWYVDHDFTLKYIERYIDEENWSTPRKINLVYEEENLQHWHLDLIKTDKGYEILINAFPKGQKRNKMKLYYTKSVDNVYYDIAKVVLEPLRCSWNDKGLYRSSILYYENQYVILYSGIGYDENRGIGIAFGDSMDKLVWLTENNIYDFKKLISKTTCYE